MAIIDLDVSIRLFGDAEDLERIRKALEQLGIDHDATVKVEVIL